MKGVWLGGGREHELKPCQQYSVEEQKMRERKIKEWQKRHLGWH